MCSLGTFNHLFALFSHYISPLSYIETTYLTYIQATPLVLPIMYSPYTSAHIRRPSMRTFERVPVEIILLLVEYLPPKDQLSYLQVFPTVINLLTPRHVANTDQYGRTMLHLLALKPNELLTRLILQNMCLPIEKEDTSNATPLLSAIYSGHELMVQLLLERNANTNLLNHPSALITAVGVGRQSIVMRLLNHPAVDITAEFASDPTPLKIAIECGQVTMVKLLFEASRTRDFANIALERLMAQDVRHVVRDGHEDVTCVLIDAMDNINHGDDYRLMALHYACRTGRVELVELILANMSS